MTPDPLNVLVVDDELLIRWSIVETLRSAGHHVAEAESAATAVDTIRSTFVPDVIVLDYRLPDSADLVLLTTVRRLAPRAAVLFMTAFGTPEVIEGAMRLGAYRVLNKPFDVREFPSLVHDAYAARRK